MLHVQINRYQLQSVTQALAGLPGMFARARRSALSSLGYHIRMDLIREPVEPRLSPYTGTLARRHGPQGSTRHVDHLTHPRYKTGTRKGLIKVRRSTRSMPFARLKNMVRYQIDDSAGEVSVGLLKSTGLFADLMEQHAKGFQIAVTPKMRRMFFALGLPLASGTKTLSVPGRQWIDKVRDRWTHRAGPFFEERFASALFRYHRKNWSRTS